MNNHPLIDKVLYALLIICILLCLVLNAAVLRDLNKRVQKIENNYITSSEVVELVDSTLIEIYD